MMMILYYIISTLILLSIEVLELNSFEKHYSFLLFNEKVVLYYIMMYINKLRILIYIKIVISIFIKLNHKAESCRV